MDAQQLISEGQLGAALTALQDQIRKDPSNAKYRTFLFQLLCVQGQWNRALTQLNVAAELDAATLPMAQTYREAIQCEALRDDIFAGKRLPVVFGEPVAWIALVADARVGPVLEVIMNGRYIWVPVQHVSRIDIEAPADLRDKVWMPATFTWTNGASTVGLIPTRYAGTVQAAAGADAAVQNELLLARRTEWSAAGAGAGQRMFATDAADYALMDVRSIEFNGVGAAASDNG